MNRHLFVSLHSLLELDQLPQKRREFKGVLSQKTVDAFGITYKTVVACLLSTLANGEVQRHIRTFSTMTAGLLALSDWLESLAVTVIAMESTGIYWRPVCNLLEEGRSVILVNAEPHESHSRPQDR